MTPTTHIPPVCFNCRSWRVDDHFNSIGYCHTHEHSTSPGDTCGLFVASADAQPEPVKSKAKEWLERMEKKDRTNDYMADRGLSWTGEPL